MARLGSGGRADGQCVRGMAQSGLADTGITMDAAAGLAAIGDKYLTAAAGEKSRR
jgi:hypothetical protein